MSTETTSSEVKSEQAQSAKSETAENSEAEVDASSAEAQGEEHENPKEGEGESESDDSLEAEEKPKKKSGIQRLKERHAREMAEVRREIDALKSQAPRGQRDDDDTSAAKADSSEPKEEDFDNHKDYVKALSKWTYNQAKAEDERKGKEAQAKSAYQDQVKAHQERVEKYRSANPDYDSVVEDFIEEHGDVRFSAGLQQAIFESDEGPAVIHELLKSPDDLTRINKLSPIAAAREIGKIEARLASKSASKKIETKTTTKAPPPLKPVAAKSSGSRRSISDPDLSFKEYVQLRRDQQRRKA